MAVFRVVLLLKLSSDKLGLRVNYLGVFLMVGALVLSPQIKAESNFPLLEKSKGFAVGMYLGYLPAVGEISPLELSPESTVGEPNLLLFGISAKYRFHFLFFRTALDGGIPLFGGSGKINNQEYLFSVQQFQLPLTGGLYFPLTYASGLFLGMGTTYTNGILAVKNDLTENSYAFSGFASHFLVAFEFSITDSGYFTFEWLRNFGSTNLLKAQAIAQRELSLNNNNFMFGYAYYFYSL